MIKKYNWYRVHDKYFYITSKEEYYDSRPALYIGTVLNYDGSIENDNFGIYELSKLEIRDEHFVCAIERYAKKCIGNKIALHTNPYTHSDDITSYEIVYNENKINIIGHTKTNKHLILDKRGFKHILDKVYITVQEAEALLTKKLYSNYKIMQINLKK